MKILSCVAYGYYGGSLGPSYEYISFVDCLRQMGHQVHHFDYRRAAEINQEAMNDFFLSLSQRGEYDLILVVTKQDELFPEVLAESKQYTVTVAWNCDDDWRWESYSKHYAPFYSFMITTYRHIYEANRNQFPNLLLSQWGSTGPNTSIHSAQDIPVSFVGFCYGERKTYIERLRKTRALVAWGKDVPPVYSRKDGFKHFLSKIFSIPYKTKNMELPDHNAVRRIWQRSKISLTPLEAGQGGSKQIKARVFEMGLTGTMMLASRNDDLHEFYDPQKEYIEYDSLEECEDLARFYLSNERERERIVQAYKKRTASYHLWKNRFSDLFSDMGLENG